MYKRLFGFLFIFAVMFEIFPSHPIADSGLSNKEEVYKFLQEAFQSQVALSEEERSLEEINELLAPYFTETYKKQFLDENLVSENGKYFTYGTDAALFYIPFFTYSDATKVVTDGGKMYVFEYFPENYEGPVDYESHYEGLLLEKEAGKWKVAQFLYDEIPEEIMKKAENSKQGIEQASFKPAVEPLWLKKPSYQISFLLNPIDAFFVSRSMLLTDREEGVMALFEKNKFKEQLASN